jgi:hypothetical protein
VISSAFPKSLESKVIIPYYQLSSIPATSWSLDKKLTYLESLNNTTSTQQVEVIRIGILLRTKMFRLLHLTSQEQSQSFSTSIQIRSQQRILIDAKC